MFLLNRITLLEVAFLPYYISTNEKKNLKKCILQNISIFSSIKEVALKVNLGMFFLVKFLFRLDPYSINLSFVSKLYSVQIGSVSSVRFSLATNC